MVYLPTKLDDLYWFLVNIPAPWSIWDWTKPTKMMIYQPGVWTTVAVTKWVPPSSKRFTKHGSWVVVSCFLFLQKRTGLETLNPGVIIFDLILYRSESFLSSYGSSDLMIGGGFVSIYRVPPKTLIHCHLLIEMHNLRYTGQIFRRTKKHHLGILVG